MAENEFHFGKMMAKEWDVEFASDEYYEKLEVLTSQSRSGYFAVPCGPPCGICGDNSYCCECTT